MAFIPRAIVLLVLSLNLANCADRSATVSFDGPTAGWPSFGGELGGGHYAPLDQITAENVHLLELAWVHRSGDVRDGSAKLNPLPEGIGQLPLLKSGFQVTPIVVEGNLYYCSAFNRVIALNPETGKQLWQFDPQVDVDQEVHAHCRGVSSWQDKQNPPHCAHRIFTGTLDGRLIALDGKSGKPCTDFGVNGEIDLSQGLPSHHATEFSLVSPPAILGDLVITGAYVFDNYDVDVPSGAVRAYHARTGKLAWSWDPIPPDLKAAGGDAGGDAGGERTLRNGTANVWSIMSVDEERNLLFVPTGNTSPDYYGGQRDGLDYYSSSVVALDGATGKVVWHFQTVHHDIWDYDTPSQPTLYDVNINGKTIPALAQPTKMGHLFLLNRETGEPLFPVEERPVPQGAVAGDYTSPTQPFPTKPAPLYPSRLKPEDAWGVTPLDRGVCEKKIAAMRSEGMFTPPSLQGTVMFPGPSGGNNWGTPALDPERKIIVLNASQLAWQSKIKPREQCQGSTTPMLGTPYCVDVSILMSPLGVPCNAPPWGTLTGVDLVSGEKIWEVPLGTSRDAAPWPVWYIDGSPNIGGPMVSKSGLTFIGATTDFFLRAFKTETGEEIWRTRLPSSANSVPMSYRIDKNGRQFVVVAVGGHWGSFAPAGDHLMAFALPQRQ